VGAFLDAFLSLWEPLRVEKTCWNQSVKDDLDFDSKQIGSVQRLFWCLFIAFGGLFEPENRF